VADKFAETDLRPLKESSAEDPRLRHALEHATDGRITQHLAGVPVMLDRYRTAEPVARAVFDAAIDARRLGHPPDIPRKFLELATPGREAFPPGSFWTALWLTPRGPRLLRQFGEQASGRGRCQQAVWLYEAAAERGGVLAPGAAARASRRPRGC
jgi:hypothetical protein